MGRPLDSTVELRPHSPLWAWLFRIEWIKLQFTLSGHILGIQHVGSTAIPGLIAKPIIDISIAVADYEQAFRLVDLIELLGYKYRGENSDLREYYFIKGRPVRYNLYVTEPRCEKWRDRTLFRDYVTRHPDVARAYADLKRQLALQYPADIRAYQDAKLAFVQQVVQMARTEGRGYAAQSVQSKDHDGRNRRGATDSRCSGEQETLR